MNYHYLGVAALVVVGAGLAVKVVKKAARAFDLSDEAIREKLAKDVESMTPWQREQFRRGAKHWTDRGDQ